MDIEASYNFRRITESLTTSGIVPPDALQALRDQGYEVVVNLLPSTSREAVANEREIVEAQGIEYIYIPVDFGQPTSADFAAFSDAMHRIEDKKVHVHCAANFRVSAFTSLYLVRRGVWDVEHATNFIHSIWQPLEHAGWPDFIADVLAGERAEEST